MDDLARRTEEDGAWAILQQDFVDASYGRAVAADCHAAHRLCRVEIADGGFTILEVLVENTDDARFAVSVTRAEGWVCQFSPDAGLKLQGSCRTKRCDAPIGPFRAAWAALRVSSTVDRGDAAAARDRPTPPPAAALAQVEAAFDVGGADGWSDEVAGWSAVIPTELWEKFVPA